MCDDAPCLHACARIKKALEPYADRKIVEFNTMWGAFGGHADPSDADKFQQRTMGYTSIWCCIDMKVGRRKDRQAAEVAMAHMLGRMQWQADRQTDRQTWLLQYQTG
jgi:hypothetical protein